MGDGISAEFAAEVIRPRARRRAVIDDQGENHGTERTMRIDDHDLKTKTTIDNSRTWRQKKRSVEGGGIGEGDLLGFANDDHELLQETTPR